MIKWCLRDNAARPRQGWSFFLTTTAGPFEKSWESSLCIHPKLLIYRPTVQICRQLVQNSGQRHWFSTWCTRQSASVQCRKQPIPSAWNSLWWAERFPVLGSTPTYLLKAVRHQSITISNQAGRTVECLTLRLSWYPVLVAMAGSTLHSSHAVLKGVLK